MLFFKPGSLHHRVGLMLLIWLSLFLFISEIVFFGYGYTHLYRILFHISLRLSLGFSGFTRSPWESEFEITEENLSEDVNEDLSTSSTESLNLSDNRKGLTLEARKRELLVLNSLVFFVTQL